MLEMVIRAERENCCDDLVVATNGDAHEYASALAALEQNRWSARPAALAATGGSLVKRVRRLLDRPQSPHAALTPLFSAGVLAITAAVILTAWQSTNALTLATPYTEWLTEDVAYIITDQERAAFKRLPTDEEREYFIEQFWLRRDPTPGTPANEFKKEDYRRIAHANQHYAAAGISGCKTDRGRIYTVARNVSAGSLATGAAVALLPLIDPHVVHNHRLREGCGCVWIARPVAAHRQVQQ